MLNVGDKVKRQGAVNVVAADGDDYDGTVVEWEAPHVRHVDPVGRVTVELKDGTKLCLHDVEEQKKTTGRP